MGGDKIDGYEFKLKDGDLNIDFEIDEQSGMVEICAKDKDGSKYMYIKRETAMFLAIWMKSRLSN